jgi:hypothetical protein
MNNDTIPDRPGYYQEDWESTDGSIPLHLFTIGATQEAAVNRDRSDDPNPDRSVPPRHS